MRKIRRLDCMPRTEATFPDRADADPRVPICNALAPLNGISERQLEIKQLEDTDIQLETVYHDYVKQICFQHDITGRQFVDLALVRWPNIPASSAVRLAISTYFFALTQRSRADDAGIALELTDNHRRGLEMRVCSWRVAAPGRGFDNR